MIDVGRDVHGRSETARRAELALAEALIPPGRRWAGADEQLADDVRRLVGEISPQAASRWSQLVSALDAAAILSAGAPFRSLGVDAQQRVIDGWAHGPRPLRAAFAALASLYKLVYFDRDDVRAGLGEKPLVPVRPEPAKRWHEQIRDAHTQVPGSMLECDVVIVGSGAGGAVAAAELTRHGLAVVVVEEGHAHGRDAFGGSAIDAHRRFYRSAFAIGEAVFPIFSGRIVGGSTAINGGTCFRPPERVLRRWAHDAETEELSPERMAAWVTRVEETIGVAPTPRTIAGPIAEVFERGCAALGWSHEAVRRNAPGCQAGGFCDFGCRTGARRSVDRSFLPGALERGAVMITGARIESLVLESGAARGVRFRVPGGWASVRARAVVLAAGTLETAPLLARHRVGGEHVGNNVWVHPSVAVSALFDHPIDGHRHVPQPHASDALLDEGVLLIASQAAAGLLPVVLPYVGRPLVEAMDRASHTATIGALVADTGAGGTIVMGRTPRLVRYGFDAAARQRLHRGFRAAGELCWAAGARTIHPATLGARPITSRAAWKRAERSPLAPADYSLVSYHPLGACRMAIDPSRGVVGPDHEVFGTRDLFVMDGSVFPGPLGVNPQVTIMALAWRAARRLGQRLSR